ncbi:RluA family pseudouridine synthase [Pontibacillus marinus]|uniref:Pseudouridine synthase n=1 Tax=Pontibacillus marinus BH030004 = DSM 16465 TaxID=1385511 RepID=A0A0A5G063_9BACI|nr:RluA family pseudouridine synthase [Pontibacillus marinus]KGX85439.1 RNA pseudouridine synthase [Pontibacillus marinus BH030004 = DSM 16465]
MKWIIQEEQDGMLVRDYLMSVRAFSRSLVKTVKMEGQILLNEHLVTVRSYVAEGDQLEVRFPPEQRGRHLQPVHKPIEILYEDEEVIVLNKPAHLATIPSIHNLEDTLANRLMAYYDEIGIQSTAHIITRLDRDTSGIVLVAKNRYIHSILGRSQENNGIHRTYIAVVEGRLNEREGTIRYPIGRKPGSIIERMVDLEEGKTAVTHYQVLQCMAGRSLIQVRLETGRTHQVRVHFSYIGHPLLGDSLYGGMLGEIERQALHCCSISFVHPTSKEIVEIEAGSPEDMKGLSGGL